MASDQQIIDAVESIRDASSWRAAQQVVADLRDHNPQLLASIIRASNNTVDYDLTDGLKVDEVVAWAKAFETNGRDVTMAELQVDAAHQRRAAALEADRDCGCGR